MAGRFLALFLAAVLCFSYVRADEQAEHADHAHDHDHEHAHDHDHSHNHTHGHSEDDLHSLLNSTEHTLTGAKAHVEHMLNLSPLPNQEKLPELVKNESAHLAHEVKKLATKLHEVISEGEHKQEVKDAVNAAVPHLNEAAGSLEHDAADLKQGNTHYFAAADKLLHEIQVIVKLGPCDKVAPLLAHALHELKHDVNNYQFGIHETVGPHEGKEGDSAHKHDGDDHHGHGAHHKVHQHTAKSSEESGESSEGHKHHHHHSGEHHHH